MRRVAHVVCLAALGLLLSAAEAGHELPIYPSYYPQEIRLEIVDPLAAARRLPDGGLHAYVGAEPTFAGRAPDTVSRVESLGSYLVLTFRPAFVARNDRQARCAAAGALARAMARRPGRAVVHPYPVTPYHADYFYHVDLAEAARRRFLDGAAGRDGAPAEVGRDATVEKVSAADLVASFPVAPDGRLGPPWVKAGWFQAVVLLGGGVTDPAARAAVESMTGRLERADYGGPEDKLNLERDLVMLLVGGCERVVLGYTVKREYFSAEYSAGIENVAYDSETGLNSPLFIRTAKLKDFPWNGWLRIGIGAPPSSAWNPVGGFTDPAGRLIWHAVGDPALLPAPYADGWVLNRIVDVRRERQR